MVKSKKLIRMNRAFGALLRMTKHEIRAVERFFSDKNPYTDKYINIEEL